MKRTIFAIAAAAIAGSACAASDFVDTAQVISSKPIIERVSESRQECDNVPAPQKSGSVVAPILGGVIGGLLGHQVGQGSGQTAATIGGAVAGNVIGNRASSQPEQRCRTIESSREVVNGYDVVYRYNGRDVSVALPYNPGNTIKVGVAAILDDREGRAGSGNDNYDNRPQRRRGPQ